VELSTGWLVVCILTGFMVVAGFLGVIVLFFAYLNLSYQHDELYHDREDELNQLRDSLGELYRLLEAVDECATGGAGNTLYLQRLRHQTAGPRQHV
jgi:hypothetical protein